MMYLFSNSYFSFGVTLILLVSLVGNGVLFYVAKHYYTRSKLTEVFPTHESYYQKANQRLLAKAQQRIVLFGNSRIQMWKNLPYIDGFEFVNRGIGGETTAQNRARFQNDVLALKPDVVILQSGINDLTTLGVQPQRYEEITQQCFNHLKFFVESLLVRQIKVIFLTIIPPAQPELARRFVWNDKIAQSVAEINHYWLNLTPTEHLQVIDTAKVLKDAQGHWHPGVNLDVLHLTPAGYDYLNQALISIL